MFVVPDDILEQLICDFCHKYLSVKIVKIIEKHGRCKKICGRCNIVNYAEWGRMPPTVLSYLYGFLSENVLYKCINRFEGCDKLLTSDEVLKHEFQCYSTNHTCFICKFNKGIKTGVFEETAKIPGFKMVYHVKGDHPKLFLTQTKINKNLNDLEKWNVFYYIMDNHIFFIFLIFKRQDQVFLLKVYYIGGGNKMKTIEITGTIIIGSDKMKHTLKFVSASCKKQVSTIIKVGQLLLGNPNIVIDFKYSFHPCGLQLKKPIHSAIEKYKKLRKMELCENISSYDNTSSFYNTPSSSNANSPIFGAPYVNPYSNQSQYVPQNIFSTTQSSNVFQSRKNARRQPAATVNILQSNLQTSVNQREIELQESSPKIVLNNTKTKLLTKNSEGEEIEINLECILCYNISLDNIFITDNGKFRNLLCKCCATVYKLPFVYVDEFYGNDDIKNLKIFCIWDCGISYYYNKVNNLYTHELFECKNVPIQKCPIEMCYFKGSFDKIRRQLLIVHNCKEISPSYVIIKKEEVDFLKLHESKTFFVIINQAYVHIEMLLEKENSKDNKEFVIKLKLNDPYQTYAELTAVIFNGNVYSHSFSNSSLLSITDFPIKVHIIPSLMVLDI